MWNQARQTCFPVVPQTSAPLPAFAFFFVSMFLIILLGFKADAAKLSISTIDLIADRAKLPSRRRIIKWVSIIIGIVVVLSMVIPISIEKYPALLIFGIVSFGITLAIIIVLNLILLGLIHLCYMKTNFRLWKDSIFASSFESRCEAAASLKSLESPAIQVMGKLINRIAPLFLLVWFVVMVLATCAVLHLDRMGVWRDLADNGLVPENWTHISR